MCVVVSLTLQDGEANNEGRRLVPQGLESARDDPEHERSAEKADKLDGLSANVFDSENGCPVPRQESSTGDDEVSVAKGQ